MAMKSTVVRAPSRGQGKGNVYFLVGFPACERAIGIFSTYRLEFLYHSLDQVNPDLQPTQEPPEDTTSCPQLRGLLDIYSSHEVAKADRRQEQATPSGEQHSSSSSSTLVFVCFHTYHFPLDSPLPHGCERR